MDNTMIASLLKKYPIKHLEGGVIRCHPARLSYPNIFTKSKDDGEFKGKFGATLLLPTGVDIGFYDKLLLDAGRAKHGNHITQKMLRWPIRDQGEMIDKKTGKLKVGYVDGAMFFRAGSDRMPGTLRSDGRQVTEADLYPGCWVVCTVRAFGYDNKGIGVSFGLQNVMKVADDDRFGIEIASARDHFADMLDGNDDAGDYFNDNGGDASEGDVSSLM